MNEDPQDNSRESSESIQELRDEMRNDVRGLASAIERRPRPKPGVSPLAVVASVFGSLFVGAAGMSLYDSQTEPTPESANVRADLLAAISPYTEQLKTVTQAIVAAQQTAAEDAKAQGVLLDSLAETVTGLQRSNTAVYERVDLLVEELTANDTRVPKADGQAKAEGQAKADGEAKTDGEPTVAARQPIPNGEDSAVQPATAEADVNDAGDDLAAVVEKPVAPEANKPERGELVIDNPSGFELKLLINGSLQTIKARGVSTFDIAVGTVKTQIASLPEVVQTWDKWETVDGVKRLTIKVESGSDYYKLR